MPPTDTQKCIQFVMKDNSISDPEKSIVAFARYFVFGEDWRNDWRERWEEKLVEGLKEDNVGAKFFDPMARQHRVAVGEKRHLCKSPISHHWTFLTNV